MTCGPPLIRRDWLWWATLKVLCLFPNSDQANLEGKTHVSCDVRLDLHTRFLHYTQVWELEKGLMQQCKGMANMHISQVLQWVLFQLDVCFSLTLSWHPFKRPLGFTGMANIMIWKVAPLGKKTTLIPQNSKLQYVLYSQHQTQVSLMNHLRRLKQKEIYIYYNPEYTVTM